MCDNCHSESQEVWAIGPPYPEWEAVAAGNCVQLVACGSCGQLWLESYYEPFASFRYAVKWAGDRALFEAEREKDQGLTLCKWHEAEVRFVANRANAATLANIKAHYERSRGYVNLLPSPDPNPVRLGGT